MPRILETEDATPMRLAAEVLRPTTPPSGRDAEIVATVQDLAAEYATLTPAARRSFLGEVRKLTTGYDRFRATVHTPPESPSFGPLMAMLDGLNASAGIVQTQHGAFTVDDLRLAGAMTVGTDRIRFPVAYAATGTPLFRSADFAGPTITPFRVVRSEEVKRPASMWGDDE